MRILGLAGLVVVLAIVGYLVVAYVQDADTAQKALREVPGAPAGGTAVDASKRGLEQRLAPVLNQERQRVEEASRATQ